jgi:hypothetical protein
MTKVSLKKQTNIEWDSDNKIHPWRRFFARILDMNISFFLIKIIASILFGFNVVLTIIFLDSFSAFTLTSIIILFLIFILSFVAHIFINAFLISRTGTSIGKYCFGISVYNTDGTFLEFEKSLKREWMVFYKGQGLWIPIINLIALIIAYFDLKDKGISSWDKELGTEILYRAIGIKHYIFVLIGIILIFKL